MGKPKTVPLARGLIAGETDPIYGQLEISLVDDSNIEILIQRKPYSGQSDISLSIPQTSLQSIFEILQQAREKLDENWLSRVATAEQQTRQSAEASQVQNTED